MSCQYQGFDFGAPYLDSVCIDGRLFDADYCDGEGNLYEPAELKYCPICHPEWVIETLTEDVRDGCEVTKKWQRRRARKHAKRYVKSIRKNRHANGAIKPEVLARLMARFKAGEWVPVAMPAKKGKRKRVTGRF